MPTMSESTAIILVCVQTLLACLFARGFLRAYVKRTTAVQTQNAAYEERTVVMRETIAFTREMQSDLRSRLDSMTGDAGDEEDVVEPS